MPLIEANKLNQSYTKYQSRIINQVCKDIPEERREQVVIKIRSQLLIGNAANQIALEKVLKILEPKVTNK